MHSACGRYPDRRGCWILAALLVCAACGKTPVDAIVSELDGSAPMSGDSCTDGVSSVTAGQYRLRAVSSGQCLAVGGSTTVLGTPAWLTAMAEDCLVAGEVWQLTPVLSGQNAGSFEVRSTQFGDNLDIEMAQTADGTRVLLYEPLTLANQRFFFEPRRARVFEVAPAHVALRASCLSSAPPFPSIARCSEASSEQEWQLLPADCG